MVRNSLQFHFEIMIIIIIVIITISLISFNFFERHVIYLAFFLKSENRIYPIHSVQGMCFIRHQNLHGRRNYIFSFLFFF